MTAIEPEEDLPPVAHVVLVYNGPVAPHWEMQVRYGEPKMLDEFWTRVSARLLLLPKHDPQFRRNRERVNRDAERELIVCDWDLGEGDNESTITKVAPPPGLDQQAAQVEVEEVAEVQEVAEEAAEVEETAEAEVEESVVADLEPEAVPDSVEPDSTEPVSDLT